MIPGVDPRQMKAMMRQMGMSQVDIDAIKVTIETPDKLLVFEKPSVQKITMQGQATFQIAGSYTEVEVVADVKISDDDIEMVAEQAGVSKKEAREALERAGGDIAKAIVDLTGEED